MEEETVFMDIVKMPLLAVTILIISLIGIYFNVPLMIPAFGASLFMICLREGSEFAHFKNVFGGHLIGFGCAFLEPLIIEHVTFLPENLSKAVIIGIAVLIAGLLMAITRLEHPPAIATTLIFFNIKKQGYLLFNIIPLNSMICFFVGLAIVSGIAYFMYKKKR